MKALLADVDGGDRARSAGRRGIGVQHPLGRSVIAQSFSGSPIAAPIAALLAVLTTGFFAAAVWLYHRTIDDHEERAYLWGSQLAYYLLVLALPAWWLLERGGIVGPVTATVALIAILISFLVQEIVWAWLKFR